MSNEGRKIKPVSFNIRDEYEYSLLEFVETVNPLTGRVKSFSKYIKRLIEDDMKRTNRGMVHNVLGYQDDYEQEYSVETKDAMSSFF